MCSDEVGLQRGENEPCAYVHHSRELLALLYVDDCIQDGEHDDIEWLSTKMTGRFDCKDTEWLCIDEPLDILGVTTSINEQYLYMCMHDYIIKCLKALDWEDLEPV